MAPHSELSLADHACLAIVAEGPTHGWAIVKLLAPSGELGRIWSLSRPLTYRSIDKLVEAGLVSRTESGRRAVVSVTRAGAARLDEWLSTPVAHLRDIRTEFLLKLALCERAGRDTRLLVTRQRAALAPAIESLTTTGAVDAVDVWRQESALAADRFLARIGTRHRQ